jgi:predicted lipoprotein with Yx(FWY)xxD motif
MIGPALVVLLIAAVLAGCGDEDDAGATTTREPTSTATPTATAVARPAPPARRGKTIKVMGSQFGRIIADVKGQAIYVFDKEDTRRSECYGDCATAWPPVLTRGRPVAGSGVRAGLLGTTRRRDGRRQVTYRGRPLYYYAHEEPRQVLCHGVDEFGGLWLVVRPNGMPVPV